MHGNVWQWCQDSFEGGPERVIRGGSWYGHGKYCRAAVGGKNIVTGQSPYIGFRLVRVADAGK